MYYHRRGGGSCTIIIIGEVSSRYTSLSHTRSRTQTQTHTHTHTDTPLSLSQRHTYTSTHYTHQTPPEHIRPPWHSTTTTRSDIIAQATWSTSRASLQQLVWLWAGTQWHLPSFDKYGWIRSCIRSHCQITITSTMPLTRIWSEFYYRRIIGIITCNSSYTSSLRPQHHRETRTLSPLTGSTGDTNTSIADRIEILIWQTNLNCQTSWN